MRLAIVLLAAGCAAHAFTPADDQAIRAAITAQAAAWNRGDLAGYMAGYAKSPDLVFTSGGQIRRGWQETFDRYRTRYGGDPSTMGHLDFELLQIQPLGADGAIVLGRWKLDGPQAGAGVFSLAVQRTRDGWRIVHDHTSLDAKP
jgi:ketosteroid isomerase-like protein